MNENDPWLEIRRMNRNELEDFVRENANAMGEGEALAILANRFCSIRACMTIAQDHALTSFDSVRVALVANRRTPQGQALRLIPLLYQRDLVRLSSDVRVLPPVRRAIDKQIRQKLPRMTIGERKTLARLCSRELIPDFLADAVDQVFETLLVNPRLGEEALIDWIESEASTAARIAVVASHSRWKERYAVRLAIARSRKTPKAVAASQLPHLNRKDLMRIASDGKTSLYLRQCIERLGLIQK